MNTRTQRFLTAPYYRFILRATLLALVLLASVIALSIADQKRTDAEMGAVLSALFSSDLLHDLQYWGANREIQIIVLRESLNTWKSGEFRGSLLFDPRSSFSESSSITRGSFILSNVLPTNIKTQLVLPNRAKFFLISSKELEEPRPNDFQTRFPNNWGYFVISHIGLSLNKTEAILYIDHFCGGLCGGGEYFFMRKLDGVWRVVDQHILWMS
jgi:hypothetical protein